MIRYNVQTLSSFSPRPLFEAEKLQRKYTFFYWFLSIMFLAVALFLSFYFIDYHDTLFQIASSLYTTSLIDLVIEFITVYEHWKVRIRNE
jgi:hypothetical protein